ncbi:hypothetical protein Esi_0066_0014 [Ectocarpus siliculosus]|uniref:Uncharacterized protein n=1 Tax=Ectocarpus siliculosus TaxID=2880 RepID=D8LRE8_ECTSI|nr:hypothetical protein Esi_0066_0014 [Ectocarpus siliculosus]|eukprot:CBN75049.1 hypothetical protein Esi_0066_0014 [Ectocarpus siliculosus]
MAMKMTTAARIGIASILLIVLLALSGTSASAGSALRGRDVDHEGDVDLLAEAGEINWRGLQGTGTDGGTPSPTAVPTSATATGTAPSAAAPTSATATGTPSSLGGN